MALPLIAKLAHCIAGKWKPLTDLPGKEGIPILVLFSDGQVLEGVTCADSSQLKCEKPDGDAQPVMWMPIGGWALQLNENTVKDPGACPVPGKCAAGGEDSPGHH